MPDEIVEITQEFLDKKKEYLYKRYQALFKSVIKLQPTDETDLMMMFINGYMQDYEDFIRDLDATVLQTVEVILAELENLYIYLQKKDKEGLQ